MQHIVATALVDKWEAGLKFSLYELDMSIYGDVQAHSSIETRAKKIK